MFYFSYFRLKKIFYFKVLKLWLFLLCLHADPKLSSSSWLGQPCLCPLFSEIKHLQAILSWLAARLNCLEPRQPYFFRNSKRGLELPYKEQSWGMLNCKKDFIQSCQVINALENPSALYSTVPFLKKSRFQFFKKPSLYSVIKHLFDDFLTEISSSQSFPGDGFDERVKKQEIFSWWDRSWKERSIWREKEGCTAPEKYLEIGLHPESHVAGSLW